MIERAVRKVDPSEHVALAGMWHAAWHEAHGQICPPKLVMLRNLADFQHRIAKIAPLSRVIGLVGAPEGFCAVRSNEIYQLFVAPCARGTGAAAALIADGEHRIRQTGHHAAFLDCHPGNLRALKFYERSGWQTDKIAPVQLETSQGPFVLDTMILRKVLA